jgi:2-dehydropantoate 2-reductase
MRIAVIGAGGTGGLYGGLLARAGNEVAFLARGAHLAAIKERGLEVRSADFGTFHVAAPASDNPAGLAPADLVLFTVKTYDLASALPAAVQLRAPGGHILTLQNGLDAPDQVAAAIGPAQVLVGTTALETTILEPGVIGHLTPGHVVTIAALEPDNPAAERTAEIFKAAAINTNVAADARRALWEKAYLLIPLATLTSLCQAPMGPIRELPETRALMEMLLREIGLVAAACGYELPELAQRAVAGLDRVPYTMKASMARDFERGGRTELEALTGAVVRLAGQHGVDVPATRTAYAALKMRDQQAARTRTAAVGSATATQ